MYTKENRFKKKDDILFTNNLAITKTKWSASAYQYMEGTSSSSMEVYGVLEVQAQTFSAGWALDSAQPTLVTNHTTKSKLN